VIAELSINLTFSLKVIVGIATDCTLTAFNGKKQHLRCYAAQVAPSVGEIIQTVCFQHS
jgi:hypothetical protein